MRELFPKSPSPLTPKSARRSPGPARAGPASRPPTFPRLRARRRTTTSTQAKHQEQHNLGSIREEGIRDVTSHSNPACLPPSDMQTSGPRSPRVSAPHRTRGGQPWLRRFPALILMHFTCSPGPEIQKGEPTHIFHAAGAIILPPCNPSTSPPPDRSRPFPDTQRIWK